METYDISDLSQLLNVFQAETSFFPPPFSALASFLTDLHPFSELALGVNSCTALSLPLILVWYGEVNISFGRRTCSLFYHIEANTALCSFNNY